MDYAKKRPLKLVTLKLKSGSSTQVLALYDQFNEAWMTTPDLMNVSYRCYALGSPDAMTRAVNDLGTINKLIEECVSTDVEKFYFGNVDTYSTGETCGHVSFRKIGNWEFSNPYYERDGVIHFLHAEGRGTVAKIDYWYKDMDPAAEEP